MDSTYTHYHKLVFDSQQNKQMNSEETKIKIPSLYKNEINLLEDFEPNRIYEIEVFPQFILKCLYSTENDDTFRNYIDSITNPEFTTIFFKKSMIFDEFISICSDDHVLLLPISSKIQVDETLDRVKESTVYCIGADDQATLNENFNTGLIQNYGSDEKLNKIREKLHYRISERFEVYTSDQSVVMPNKTTYSTFIYLTEEVMSTYYDLLRSHRSLSALSQTPSESQLDDSRLPSLYRKEIDIFSKFEENTIYEIEVFDNFYVKCLLPTSNDEVFESFLKDISTDTVSTIYFKQNLMNREFVTICVDNHVCLLPLSSEKVNRIVTTLQPTKLYCLNYVEKFHQLFELNNQSYATNEEIESATEELSQKVLERFDICNLASSVTVSFRSSVSSYFYMTQEAISAYYDLKNNDNNQNHKLNTEEFPPNTIKSIKLPTGHEIQCVYATEKVLLNESYLENARFNPKTAYHFLGHDLIVSCSNLTILLLQPTTEQLNQVFFHMQNCELFPVSPEDQDTFSKYYYIDDRHVPSDDTLNDLRKELIHEIARCFPIPIDADDNKMCENLYLKKSYEGILAYEVFRHYKEISLLNNPTSTMSLINDIEIKSIPKNNFDLNSLMNANESTKIEIFNHQIMKSLLSTENDVDFKTFLNEIGCDQFVCVNLKKNAKDIEYFTFCTNHHLLVIPKGESLDQINDVLYQIQNCQVFCVNSDVRSELFKYFKFDLIRSFTTQKGVDSIIQSIEDDHSLDEIKLDEQLTYSSFLFLCKEVIQCYNELHIKQNEIPVSQTDDELASSEEIDNDVISLNPNVIQRNINELLPEPTIEYPPGYTFKSCDFYIFNQKAKTISLSDKIHQTIELNEINSNIKINRYQTCNCLISTAEPLALNRYLRFLHFDRVVSYHFCTINDDEYLTLCSQKDLILIKNPSEKHLEFVINKLNESTHSIIVPVNTEDICKHSFISKIRNLIRYDFISNQPTVYSNEFEFQEPFTISTMMNISVPVINVYLYSIQQDECERFREKATEYKYIREPTSIYELALRNRFEVNTVQEIELAPNHFCRCLMSYAENLVLKNYLNHMKLTNTVSFNFSSSSDCNSSFFTLCTGRDLLVVMNPTAEVLSIVFQKIQKCDLIPVNANDVEKLKFYDYSGQMKNLMFINQTNDIKEEIENCKQQIFSDPILYSNQFDYGKFLFIGYKTFLTHFIRYKFKLNLFNQDPVQFNLYHLSDFIKLRKPNERTYLVMHRDTNKLYQMVKYNDQYHFNRALYTYKHLKMSCLASCYGFIDSDYLLFNYGVRGTLKDLVKSNYITKGNTNRMIIQLLFGLAYLHLKGQFPIKLTLDNIIVDFAYNIQYMNYDQIPVNLASTENDHTSIQTPERYDLLNLMNILMLISKSNPIYNQLYPKSQNEKTTICDLISLLLYPSSPQFDVIRTYHKQLPQIGEYTKMFPYDDVYQNVIEIFQMDSFSFELLKLIEIGETTSVHINTFNDFIFSTLKNTVIVKNIQYDVMNKLLEKMSRTIIIPQEEEDVSKLFAYYGFDYLHNFLRTEELNSLRANDLYNEVIHPNKEIHKAFTIQFLYDYHKIITQSLSKLILKDQILPNQIKRICFNDNLTITCLYSNDIPKINKFTKHFKGDVVVHFHSDKLSLCSNNHVLLTNNEYQTINYVLDSIKRCKLYSVNPNDRSELFKSYKFDLIKEFGLQSEIDQINMNLISTIRTLFKFNFVSSDHDMTYSSFFNITKETISFYYLLTNKHFVNDSFLQISGIDENNKFNEYMKYAERGNSAALFNVGVMHSRGIGVTQDKLKAAEYYQKAADKGNAKAQLNLSLMYQKGNGVIINKEKAFELCKLAAEQGNVKAQSNLGYMYQKGEGCEKDIEQAIEWYTKAGENGDSEAYLNLAFMHDHGDEVPVDKQKAVDYYQRSADLGNAKAQFNLGTFYHRGLNGITKDNDKAVELYTMAALKGLAQAQFNLGVIYSKGDDAIEKDSDKAVQFFAMAAEQGDADALLNLGAMYAKGDGVPKNLEKTVELYEQAAELNNPKAQFNLGIMYSKGQGVPKDNKKAAMYFEKASEQNLQQAKFNLACMLLKGDGVPEDKEKAIKLLQEASDAGNAKAQFNLAVLYQKGDGVPKDMNKAFDLYNQSAMKNNSDSLLNLGVIYSEGTDEIEKNVQKSFECYQKAAALNNSKAMLYLGLLYQQNLVKSDVVERGINSNEADQGQAFEWFTKSAELGNPQAIFLLGKIYLNPDEHDDIVEQDLEKSEFYLRNALKTNNEALLYLGDLYMLKDEPETAQQLYQKALELGVENASYRLMKFRQRGVDDVFNELEDDIHKLHQKTHQTKFMDFKSTLGDIIDFIHIPFEHTTKKGLSDCIYTYKQSNEILKSITNEVNQQISSILDKRSHLPSLKPSSAPKTNCPENDAVDELNELNQEIHKLEYQFQQLEKQIQMELEKTPIIKPHEPTAEATSRNVLPPSPRSQRNRIKNLLKQAEEGDSAAMFFLGACYALGDGVEQNRETALEYYLKAAEMGNKNAQFACASCFSYGKGTDIDKIRALEYYLKAAEQGHPKAEFAVGHFYEYGQGGLVADHETAKVWYRKSANQGYQAARKALDLFSSEATIDDYSPADPISDE